MSLSIRTLLIITVSCLVAASCGSDTSDSTEPVSPEVLHAMPVGSMGVIGTADCGFFDTGTDPENPEAEEGDLVRCDLEMSDPRVSGTEIHDRFRYYDLGDNAFAWVAEDATITNDEGAWTGIAQAVDDGTPIGEALYVGKGAYEGLEFHYYFTHASIAGKAEIHGWITEDGS